MSEINLLPQDLKPRGYVLRVSKIIKKVVIVGLSCFVVLAIILTSVLIVISSKVKDSKERQSTLESQIKALEETEQRLVLVQDRLDKISNISSFINISKELKLTEESYSVLPDLIIMDKLKLGPGKVEMGFVAPDSTSLKDAFSAIESLNKLNTFYISSVSHQLGGAYRVEISLN